MATNECIFCGNSPTTKEDILSEWIRVLIADLFRQSGAVGSRFFRQRTAPDGTVKERDEWEAGEAPRLVAKCVCEACKGGWMSGFETAVQKPLTALILGQDVILDQITQDSLARWLGLKAMVEHFSRGEQPPLIKEWIDAFYAARRPPSGWHIRVGRYTGPRIFNSGGGSIDANVNHPLVPFAFAMPGFVFTITIGSFLGQVIGISRQANVPVDPRYLIQVWPEPLLRVNPPVRAGAYGDVETWPPERGLNQEQLLQLRDKPIEPVA